MKSVRRVQLYTCSLLHVQRHVDLSRLLRNLQNIKAPSLSKYTDNILVQKLESWLPLRIHFLLAVDDNRIHEGDSLDLMPMT